MMSDLKKYLILYSSENHQVAEQISSTLQGAGQESMILEKTKNDYSEQVGQVAMPAGCHIVFLLTDNFLKSYGCMNGILQAAHKWGDEEKLMAVVTSGVQTRDDGTEKSVSTNFERVGDIIQYMNYWQDKYLLLRKEKREREDDEELDEHIAITKEISADVGEFLRYIRGIGYFNLEDFYEKYEVATEVDPSGESLPEGAAFLDSGTYQTPEGPPKPDERSLVEMIENSSEELFAENADLNGDYDQLEETEEKEAELLKSIPGLDLLKEIEMEEDSPEQNLLDELLSEEPNAPVPEAVPAGNFSKKEIQKLDEENDELMSILDEVFMDEGLTPPPGKDEYHFVGDDPDNPGEFNIDSLFDEEEKPENLAEMPSDEDLADPEISENEMLLNLIDDEDGEVSSEEILDESVEFFRENQIEEGISHLAEAVHDNPTDTSLRYYYAYALARYAEDYEDAKSELSILLKQDGKHADAWFLLAELAENQQDYEGARKSFKKVLECNPDFPETEYRLGLLIADQFEGDEEIAAAHLKKAIQQNEQNVDALYMLATLMNENLDQPENSVKHFRRALNIQPAHPFANYDLAMVYHQLNDMVRAKEYYLKAININPELRTEQNDHAFGLQTVENKAFAGTQSALANANPSTMNIVDDPELEKLLEADVEETSDLPTETINGTEMHVEEEIHQAPVPNPGVSIAEETTPVMKTKVVLVTGGTSGIGKATAEVFAKNGYRVMITGRREHRLEEISNEFSKKYNVASQALSFDVRDPESVEAAINDLPDDWKNIDILINNAGLSKGLEPIHEGHLDDWDAMIDTNVKGLLYVTRAISPYMVERKNGHIINVSSIAGTEVYPGGNVYSASKAAVSSLTRSMRLDLHKHNIRVSQVSPGHVEETEFARVRFDGNDERAAKVYENFQPLRSSDVAETIFFIATRPAHVNIQDIYMYGTQQASATMIERSGR